MATELEHPDYSPLGEFLDTNVEEHKKALEVADNEVNAVMARMAKNKEAMERAQGTEDYWRFAIYYDMSSVEYKNAWLQREQLILRHENICAQEFIKKQLWISGELLDGMNDLQQRVILAEAAVSSVVGNPRLGGEVSAIIAAYQQGMVRERTRNKPLAGTPEVMNAAQVTK